VPFLDFVRSNISHEVISTRPCRRGIASNAKCAERSRAIGQHAGPFELERWAYCLEPAHRNDSSPSQMLEWPMTDQRDLDGKRQLDYIDQDTSVGWAPILLGVAFVALLALLIFTSPSGPPSERPIISQKSELPNTAPGAPPAPTPAPPQPQ